jgi:CRISPR/Cas system-associated endonuclease/helicase Cas3
MVKEDEYYYEEYKKQLAYLESEKEYEERLLYLKSKKIKNVKKEPINTTKKYTAIKLSTKNITIS